MFGLSWECVWLNIVGMRFVLRVIVLLLGVFWFMSILINVVLFILLGLIKVIWLLCCINRFSFWMIGLLLKVFVRFLILMIFWLDFGFVWNFIVVEFWCFICVVCLVCKFWSVCICFWLCLCCVLMFLIV